MSSVPNSQRYSRQILLAEVGVAGQEQLGRVSLDLSRLRPDIAAAAELYAAACGVGGELGTDDARSHDKTLVAVTARPAADVESFFRHQASSAVGLGASAALSAALSVLIPPVKS